MVPVRVAVVAPVDAAVLVTVAVALVAAVTVQHATVLVMVLARVLAMASPAAALAAASSVTRSRVPVAEPLSPVPVQANSVQPTSRASSNPKPPRVRAVARVALRPATVDRFVLARSFGRTVALQAAGART
tara:strand:- start:103 stop:495 length:393 start_codon:yes stop_codon:yes gene_type:complete